ncbi:MAG: FRG domain-containing protein [Herbiconiux sp.]|uniref:FRG domain-containing protein n=1 Tax=Herbiconiux sp. TaxID=1871186 RepID=UPI0012111D46|nr:FRG domain-containing protein [Herbiconiux sp.]TAJ47855.1 MAG: FRG domain-containing protein [Herbiconiux sp.]
MVSNAEEPDQESDDASAEQSSAEPSSDSSLSASVGAGARAVAGLSASGLGQSALSQVRADVASGAVVSGALAKAQADIASGALTAGAIAQAEAALASGAALQGALSRAQAAIFESGVMQASIAKLEAAIAAGQFRTRSSAEETPSSYSDEMKSAASYFSHTEKRIGSLQELHASVAQLTSKNPSLRFVWRGVRDASWGLHSGLFLELMKLNEVVPPKDQPSGPQPYPNEHQMIETEASMLEIARTDWRMDDGSPLELLARMQHYGAPTRLIDVTKNPYIGAWFATEASEDTDHIDGRLFAIATASPIAGATTPKQADTPTRNLTINGQPFWFGLSTPEAREDYQWGTGSRRRIWVPPAYDPRIVAQNAAFILDGVPLTSRRVAPYFKINTESNYWKRSDLLAASSIYAKMYNPERRAQANKIQLVPTFSWRVSPEAKDEIRSALEAVFGYTRATIYPDIGALSSHLRSEFASFATPLEAG